MAETETTGKPWLKYAETEPKTEAPKSAPWEKYKGTPLNTEPEGWISGGADAGMVVLSPVALVAAFLLVRAIAIRSRPPAEREAARRALGVWPRLLIVLSCFWSCLLLGLVAWVAAHGEQVYPTRQMFVVTIAPLLGMWVIYFAARWIRQGAA